MNIKDLMGIGYGEEPDMNAELYIDHLINAPWFGAKELCDNVGKVPPERAYEVSKTIDECIQLLALAKLGLQQKQN